MDVADLLTCGQREGKDPARRQTRSDFAGWLHTGHTGYVWPPERNAPCWCGCGGNYKRCRGNPSFLAIEPPDPASLVLRIELDDVTPHVWRRVAIPSNTPLDPVHLMFQDAMGWHDEHMYAFETDDHTIIDPARTPAPPQPRVNASYPSPPTRVPHSPTCTTSATTGRTPSWSRRSAPVAQTTCSPSWTTGVPATRR